MRGPVKLAVIGGGSSYTPELVDGVIRNVDKLPVGCIALMDIPEGEEKLGIVAGLVRRMVARAELDIEVQATLRRDDAIRGADFVVTQFRVGGLAARAQDERIPLKYGIVGQETTGPGGFAKALRTIPVALDIAREVETLSPRAWIMNFTNPSGIITEAITRHARARCIGLCNVPLGMQRAIAAALDADPAWVELEFVGLNHLSWVRRITLNGRDVTAEVVGREDVRSWLGHSGAAPDGAARLIEALGMIPSYYLRYYYFHDAVVEEQRDRVRRGLGTRADEVMSVEKALFQRYSDPSLSEKPAELSQRGGAWYSEAAVSVMAALFNSSGETHVVCAPSGGSTPDMPADAVIEARCVIDGRGAHPVPMGAWPASVRGLAQHVKAYEQLTIQAALTGDEQAAYLALVNHPLVPSASVAGRLLADILKANDRHLRVGS